MPGRQVRTADADHSAGPRPRAARGRGHLTGLVSANLGLHRRDVSVRPGGAGPSQGTWPQAGRCPEFLPRRTALRAWSCWPLKGSSGISSLGQSHCPQGVSGPSPWDTLASPCEAFPGEARLGEAGRPPAARGGERRAGAGRSTGLSRPRRADRSLHPDPPGPPPRPRVSPAMKKQSPRRGLEGAWKPGREAGGQGTPGTLSAPRNAPFFSFETLSGGGSAPHLHPRPTCAPKRGSYILQPHLGRPMGPNRTGAAGRMHTCAPNARTG